MITSFEMLENAYELEEDGDLYDIVDNLIENEINSLKNEINGWDREKMNEGFEVLNDYYGLSIPEKMMKEILCENLVLAYEVYQESVGDTCVREILIDAVLKKMNLRSWPINGEGSDVMKKFTEQLTEAANKFDVKINF